MQSQKSAPALTRQAVLFAIAWSIATALTTTSCKTQKTTKELQYDRQVIATSEAIKTTTLRDNSITDITIIDFDTVGQLGQWGQVPMTRKQSEGSLVPVPIDPIKRLTLIHRQNNIQTNTQDSTITREQTKQHTKIQQQNKSSPDKTSSVAVIICFAAVLLVILFLAIFIYKLLH